MDKWWTSTWIQKGFRKLSRYALACKVGPRESEGKTVSECGDCEWVWGDFQKKENHIRCFAFFSWWQSDQGAAELRHFSCKTERERQREGETGGERKKVCASEKVWCNKMRQLMRRLENQSAGANLLISSSSLHHLHFSCMKSLLHTQSGFAVPSAAVAIAQMPSWCLIHCWGVREDNRK